MNKRVKTGAWIAAAVFACLCWQDLAWAQNAARVPARDAQAQAQPLTAADLNAWLDGYMPYALASGDIAGAAVVIVRDGEVLAQRGWGHADVASGRAVDPERTVFRTGSVGKLFTWTAVMQLVERGKLDLDADINAYLDFRIPPRDGRPITLRHLMTHTPGFEERIKGIATADARSFGSLEDYVRRWVPARIYPAGETLAYSNYGVALAGYIVQRVAGAAYDDYLDTNVFAPLGMTRSSGRQPLPAILRGEMAAGYARASGSAKHFEMLGPAPAGGHSASAADMGRFMLAYLGRGRLGDARILRPETVARMWAPAHAAAPPLGPTGLGFFRDDRNGRVVVGHAGDTQYFHGVMHLLPQENVGFFVVMNSTGRAAASVFMRGDLFRRFMDRYFPDAATPPPTAATAAEHARLIAGRYRWSRRASSSFLSALYPTMETVVAPQPDGTVVVSGLPGLDGAPKRWREIAPFVWRETDGDSRLVARLEDGRVAALATDDLPVAAVLLPAPAAVSGAWNVPALGFALAVLALTLGARPVRAIARGRMRTPFPLQGRAALLNRMVGATAFIDLVFVGGFIVIFAFAASDLAILDASLDPWLRILQVLGVLAVTGAGVALWNLAMVFGDKKRGWWTKVWSTAIALACVEVAWFAFAYKLISWSVDY